MAWKIESNKQNQVIYRNEEGNSVIVEKAKKGANKSKWGFARYEGSRPQLNFYKTKAAAMHAAKSFMKHHP